MYAYSPQIEIMTHIWSFEDIIRREILVSRLNITTLP